MTRIENADSRGSDGRPDLSLPDPCKSAFSIRVIRVPLPLSFHTPRLPSPLARRGYPVPFRLRLGYVGSPTHRSPSHDPPHHPPRLPPDHGRGHLPRRG